MTIITKLAVKQLGRLARIGLSEKEENALQTDITSVLDYVDKLNTADTSNTPVTSQVTGLVDVWREDKPYQEKWSRDELLKNAPAQEKGYIKVRRVI